MSISVHLDDDWAIFIPNFIIYANFYPISLAFIYVLIFIFIRFLSPYLPTKTLLSSFHSCLSTSHFINYGLTNRLLYTYYIS